MREAKEWGAISSDKMAGYGDLLDGLRDSPDDFAVGNTRDHAIQGK
jgi:hypothetical protein